MRVLVTFAVEAEFAPWRKRRAFRMLDYDGLKLWKTTAGGSEVTVLVTGIGAQAASLAMDLMMRLADKDEQFDLCISSGLAGAICDGLNIGDVVAPRELLAEMSHTELGSGRIAVDEDLRHAALRQGAKDANCLFTTDRILVKASEKKACSSRAQSVDMESFEIVRQACAWGARSVVVRAISDAAGEDLPINFNDTLTNRHQVSVGKVLLQLVANPLALPALLRFARNSREAAEKLASFLDGYLLGLRDAPQPNPLQKQAVAR